MVFNCKHQKPVGFLLFSIVFCCKYQNTNRFSVIFNGFLLLAAPPNALFRPGKMHLRVFLTLDSFMVHDNPRPRNQSQKSKVDWCLETDHNSISIRDKPDAFFRAGNMHLPVAFFYRRLSWALSVSRNLRLYAYIY